MKTATWLALKAEHDQHDHRSRQPNPDHGSPRSSARSAAVRIGGSAVTCAASHHDDGRLQREDFVAEAPSYSSSWIHDDLGRGGTILQLISIIVICNEIMCRPRNCVIAVEIGSRPHLMGDARDRMFDPTDAVMRRSALVRPARIEAATCVCLRSSWGTGAAVACGDLRTLAAGHQSSERSGAAARMRRGDHRACVPVGRSMEGRSACRPLVVPRRRPPAGPALRKGYRKRAQEIARLALARRALQLAPRDVLPRWLWGRRWEPR
jgi:hypothetical protein